jgi:NhaA family Na+:H+ antiporter
MTAGIVKFLKTEAGGGALLALAAALALIVANSALAEVYFGVLKSTITLDLGLWRAEMTVKEWVKDGLMAIFFFVIGLELKREMMVGELSDPRAVAVPVAAAIGGAIAPPLIYFLIAGGADGRGWPVPVATDIAFALAALAVLAPGADARLRIFLLTLAVVDDLIAIGLIAILFSNAISAAYLGAAAALLGVVFILQRRIELPAIVYAALFVATWMLAVQSGVHSSVIAVATAAVVPLTGARTGKAILEAIEHKAHLVSAYFVLPIFAFAAAGISFAGLSLSALAAPAALGVALGLAAGKPLGIVGAVVLAQRLMKPKDALALFDVLRIGCLCGVGFTMSLFIGALAYAGDGAGETLMRIGVLSGSIAALALSAVLFSLKRAPDLTTP